jgi:hypothetical protein
MWIHDLSDPAAPKALGSFPVPPSASWDIDPIRQLMFLYFSDEVSIFDLANDAPIELPGSPLPLRSWYPGDNEWAFGARNLTVDPYSATVTMGRPQGTLSELMVISYDDAIPGEGTAYGQLADMVSATAIVDGFDVDVDYEERVTMLEVHGGLRDPHTNAVFVNGRAWNGSMSTDAVLAMDAGLTITASCGDANDPFCWYEAVSDGNSGSDMYSDSASCLDSTHQVYVGTAIDMWDDKSRGRFMTFSYSEDLTMAPYLTEDGNQVIAGVLPVAVVCH